ncbi:hypothetical protein ASG89_31335 [Paenibacillus sp. Soil766]|uniref:hypothetical protein n=1 Tax=Paenibacillus sp. Soil766 TaxID=1736404 RepID=UPI00070C97B3|nr:hypothetical protein [Paenibacillus sp. Soil766]KRE96461.1 hypothetical protein ASG89_31335 [Paenibacillus sp. Soil766]
MGNNIRSLDTYPWFFGIFLYKKAPNIVISIFPVSALISSLINTLGFQLGFWDLSPLIKENETISALPFDIGLFPLAACFAIYWIEFKKINPILSLLLCSISLTGIEYIGFFIKKVRYGNNRNIEWTSISYLIAAIAATL